jgi:hypothetical protein
MWATGEVAAIALGRHGDTGDFYCVRGDLLPALAGLEVAHRRIGEGGHLCSCAAPGEDARVRQPQRAALANEFTRIASGRARGGALHGRAAEFGLGGYARCLAALIEALARGPAHVAGIGGTAVKELYRHHPAPGATLILIDANTAGQGRCRRRRSAPAARARVSCSRRPAGSSDPTLPEPFAGDPPAESVALLEETAAAAIGETHVVVMARGPDQRDLLSRRRAEPADLGASSTRVRRSASRASSSRRSPDASKLEQHGAARRGRGRALPCPPAAFDLKTSGSPPRPGLPESRCQCACQIGPSTAVGSPLRSAT